MPPTAKSKFSEVHLGEESETEPVELDPERPFRILLAGDFSGRSRRKNPSRSFAPKPIDRDTFDEVLEDMQVSLNLHGMTLSFRELEDFHPDRLFQSAPAFRDLDRRVEQAAAAQVSAPTPGPAAQPRAASSGSLLDDIVSEQSPPEPASLGDANDLASFIARVSRGYTEPKPGAAQQQRTARRNALANDVMRGILHSPHVQALEAAWRAAFMLVRGLDTDGDLKIYLLDITLPELIAEMETVRKELKRKGPWAVIAGNYSFRQTETDAQALGKVSGMARSLGAPFLAEAKLQGDVAEEAWDALRHSPNARWIGLALPRFLLRLPYGKDTVSVESFPFEEMPQSDHKSYLWGNPAFFCAYLLGKSFLAHGWDMNPMERRIDGLPMHVYKEDGEPVNKPCGEVLLTEHQATDLLGAGFMPLASLKYEPAALIVRFQSIADPVTQLAGLAS